MMDKLCGDASQGAEEGKYSSFDTRHAHKVNFLLPLECFFLCPPL